MSSGSSAGRVTGSATMTTGSGVGIVTSVLGATIFFRIVLVLIADGSDSRSSTGLNFSVKMMGFTTTCSGNSVTGTSSLGASTSAKYPSESMLSVSSTGSTCMFLNSSDS